MVRSGVAAPAMSQDEGDGSHARTSPALPWSRRTRLPAAIQAGTVDAAPLPPSESRHHMLWRTVMPVQENHAVPRDFHHTAKNIDAASAMRATLASFLHIGLR